ncbi:MAG: hypothetical protein K2H29_09840 [Oscillospiraceae bacterium]|nr:hypothetical protein [Oscillospiraceae bacterium]
MKNRNCELTEDFPKNQFGLQDALDRLHQSENRNVLFRFDCDTEKNILSLELSGKEFQADLCRPNVFAERLETIGLAGICKAESGYRV